MAHGLGRLIACVAAAALADVLLVAAPAHPAVPPLLPFDCTGDLLVLHRSADCPCLLRISPSGEVSIVLSEADFSAVVPGGDASVGSGDGMALDAGGNVFLATGGFTTHLLKLAAGGSLTLLASDSAMDASAVPNVNLDGIVIGSDGFVYGIDTSGDRVLRVDPASGQVSVRTAKAALATALGSQSVNLDVRGIVAGPGVLYVANRGALFNQPSGIFVIDLASGSATLLTNAFTDVTAMTRAPNGDLIVGDRGNSAEDNRLMRVTPAGAVSVFMSADALNAAIAAIVGSPTATALGNLAFDARGNLHLGEGGGRIFRIDPALNVTQFVGPAQFTAAGLSTGSFEGIAFASSPAGVDVPLVAAILPASRSVQVGAPATAFATVINTGAGAATEVGIALATAIGGALTYQTTDPATNAVTGAPNTPVCVGPGQAQSFVLAVTPAAPLPPTELAFQFAGANTAAVPAIPGLNTLLLSASAGPVPDIVALAATPGDDGIVNVGVNGAGAFAVATVNVGTGADITVTADAGGALALAPSASLPVDLFVCETNPANAQCLATPASSLTTTIGAGATPTFSVFVAGTGTVVPFDPAANRIFVRFRDQSGATRGATSVAIRTE